MAVLEVKDDLRSRSEVGNMLSDAMQCEAHLAATPLMPSPGAVDSFKFLSLQRIMLALGAPWVIAKSF